MTHPQMFDDEDPVLARVREIARSLPGSQERVSRGHPVFFTTKIFCHYGGSVREAGAWVRHPQAIMVMADRDDREALRELPDSFVPAYLGPYGWTGIDLTADTDWTEISELIEESYRLTAPKRRVAELDAKDRR